MFGVRKTLRRLRDDRRGVSAVEFALILPVLALLYMGSIEVSFMMMADRKVTNSASALGDLVARGTTIQKAEMDNIFDSAEAIFQPYEGGQAKMRVSSLVEDKGKAKVAWSRGKNMGARGTGSTVTVPDGILPPGGSIIYAEVGFDYSSSLGFFVQGKKNLNEEFFLRPRRVDEVKISN